MGAKRVTVLVCDGCEVRLDVGGLAKVEFEDAKYARACAKQVGWTQRDGKDLCSRCTQVLNSQDENQLVQKSLPNGAVLLKSRSYPNLGYMRIVLARWCRGDKEEYVTWMVNLESKGSCTGHYFRDLAEAEKDFASR